MAEVLEHGSRLYTVQFHYALPDNAWCVELSEAQSAPESWSKIPDAPVHLPGPPFVVAVVPDEDPSVEPTVHIHGQGEYVVSYEVMRWFMEKVAKEVDRCRMAMRSTDAATIAAPSTTKKRHKDSD